MANKRFFDNPKISQYDNVAVPLTNLNDNNDYIAGGKELAEIILTASNRLWDLSKPVIQQGDALPLMQYVNDGVYEFADLSNNPDLPDWLTENNIGFARLVVKNGDTNNSMKFRRYELLYADLTRGTWETSERGQLFNGGGVPQGDTDWHSSTHEAYIAATLGRNATMDGEEVATLDSAHPVGETYAQVPQGADPNTLYSGTWVQSVKVGEVQFWTRQA